MRHVLFDCCGLLLAIGTAQLARAQTDSAPATLPVLAPATMTMATPASGPETAAASESQRPTRVAVPNMVATSSTDTELAKTLTQVLTIEVNKVRGVEAIGMADIEALLNHEQQKQLLGCEDASCIAEIGGALGVDALLSSSIGRVGETIVVSIQLNDTHSARKIGGAYETVSGKPDELIRVIQRKVPEVMRTAQPHWAQVDSSTQTRTATRTPNRQMNWPAAGVAGFGAVMILAGAGLGYVSWSYYSNAVDQSQQLGGQRYYSSGSQVDISNAQLWGFGSLGALAIGAVASAVGVAWYLLTGNAVVEETP